MDEEHGLPEGVDPELWFWCVHHPGQRDYLVSEPWQAFPGRMQAWCRSRGVWFRVSKGELPADLPLATRYWVQGFLVGNTPRQPDADDDSPAMTEWRRRADLFVSTGQWTPDLGADAVERWSQDAQVLAEIGHVLAETPLPMVEAHLPRDLADKALAAWERDEESGPDYETPAEREVRQLAADLALIGLAIQGHGVAGPEGVVVPLEADLVVAAIEASRG